MLLAEKFCMDIGELEEKKLSELREMARDMEIPGFS
ncbi:MAG: Rho termination factor N-terminal domain-containing protein, partial [Candidatus Promineifilaceae bacterium]